MSTSLLIVQVKEKIKFHGCNYEGGIGGEQRISHNSRLNEAGNPKKLFKLVVRRLIDLIVTC